MNNQLSVIIKRYLIATVIAIMGLIMIFVGLNTDQSSLFNIAAVNLFVGGVLALLFSAGILNRNLVLAIGAVCIAITIYIGWSSWNSVEATMQHIEDRKISQRLVQYNLVQIRDIQRAHKQKHGVYADSWEELEDFFNNEKIEKIEASGSVPGRAITLEERDALYDDNRAIDNLMTEQEAALLAAMGNPGNSPDLEGFRRDTVKVPYKDEYLGNLSRIQQRNELGLGDFTFDELRYIPMTDPKEEWMIETRDSAVYLGDTIPTIHVYGREPIPRFEGGKRDTIGFGNISTNSEKGTWE
tara:strand:- start:28444 stop:29337 length:894 start_codon:yes stop_codon:yes gene_type:complete